ncbi:MAG: oxygen-dependent protoporphyrinogen oxidase [Pleopsidium flavum]|nr:MAG: oxygen-dependent protoporphyrinogen oxidase [Pleopsidium flavum]
MRLRNAEHLSEVLLKQCYRSPRCQSIHQRRQYSTPPLPAHENHDVKDVAVLGGGITGLASAFYLSQELPNAKITLYEGSSRLGGWLQTKYIDVGNGHVVFEQGPRTLRPSMPNGFVTMDLIRRLDFEDQVLMTAKTSVAARNRFIYYPDHLVRMPGPGAHLLQNLYTLLTEPIFRGIPSGIGWEFSKPQRPIELRDESVGSFISRRFNPILANNVVSAVLHGIYAGDVWKLSVKSLQPVLWFWEGIHGSITNALWHDFSSQTKPMLEQDAKLVAELTEKPLVSAKLKGMRDTSVYTFKRGIGELGDRLEAKLKETKNVNIKRETAITGISYDAESGGIKISTPKSSSPRSSNADIQSYTHAISTLSSKKTAYLCKPRIISSLTRTHSVTVMVVNLYFSNPNLLSVHGFGYLIPQSIPFDQNPERALGVVFDSDAAVGQDTVPGTKVTVMLGGHWWDGWDSYPDEDEGAQMACAVLQRHLGITEPPAELHVGLQKECIPQYEVGHEDRMSVASKHLEKAYKGRLRVAGNSYTGVGLNDCVRAARDVVKGLTAQDGHMRTGLEIFTQDKKWVKAGLVPRESS